MLAALASDQWRLEASVVLLGFPAYIYNAAARRGFPVFLVVPSSPAWLSHSDKSLKPENGARLFLLPL